jgi:hypothetical protein
VRVNLSYRRPLIGRRRIFHTDAEMFSRSFALPDHPLIERILHFDSARYRAMTDTACTKPALFRVNYYRRLAAFLIRHEDIRTADLHTTIASLAKIGVDHHTLIGNIGIGHHINVIIHHHFSPSSNKYLKVAILIVILLIGWSIGSFQPVIHG